MLRKDFRDLFLKEKNENLELGIWFEVVRPLAEKVNIAWRGRPGYDWDWFVNPGFLMSYTQDERVKLIDENFRLFKEIFGEYPQVVGSWLIDSFSMDYMDKKYGIKAFAICREQYSVDAYTLWGGYFSGGYYPSKINMLCPAKTEKMQIDVPVFRMLGTDPIYGYGGDSQPKPQLTGCYTMEPVWPCGKDEDVLRWYFKTYYENNCLSGSYATTGQENSFGWESMEKGYKIQLDLAKEYEAAGKLRIETLGETGDAFKKKFSKTPASVLSAFEDWDKNSLQSFWYDCINYRANLFFDSGKLFFRDIQQFDETIEDDYNKTPCTDWKAEYYSLPIVDFRLLSDEENLSCLEFEKEAQKLISSKELSESEIEVKVLFKDGETGTVHFGENGITLYNCGEMNWSFGLSNATVTGKSVEFTNKDKHYSILLSAFADSYENGLKIKPDDNTISLKIG